MRCWAHFPHHLWHLDKTTCMSTCDEFTSSKMSTHGSIFPLWRHEMSLVTQRSVNSNMARFLQLLCSGFVSPLKPQACDLSHVSQSKILQGTCGLASSQRMIACAQHYEGRTELHLLQQSCSSCSSEVHKIMRSHVDLVMAETCKKQCMENHRRFDATYLHVSRSRCLLTFRVPPFFCHLVHKQKVGLRPIFNSDHLRTIQSELQR
jgi:hypothetical protein